MKFSVKGLAKLRAILLKSKRMHRQASLKFIDKLTNRAEVNLFRLPSDKAESSNKSYELLVKAARRRYGVRAVEIGGATGLAVGGATYGGKKVNDYKKRK